MRLLLLADMHLTDQISVPQKRMLDWLNQLLSATEPDHILLGGDLLQSDDAAALRIILDAIPGLDAPRAAWIPGNRDRAVGSMLTQYGYSAGVHRNHQVIECDDVALWLLDTEHGPEPTLEAFDALEQAVEHGQLRGRRCVLLGHRHPDQLDEASATRLQSLARRLEANEPPLWLCGHRHWFRDDRWHGWRVVATPGLDAARVMGTRPQVLAIDVTSDHTVVERIEPPKAVLQPAACRPIVLGIAALAPLTELFQRATERNIAAVQLRYRLIEEASESDAQRAITAWRGAVGDTLLSVHLPNLQPDDEASRGKVEHALDWGRRHGARDYTIHLPNKWTVDEFFDDQQRILPGRATAALEVYADLAERVLDDGAQLNLENIHNTTEHAHGNVPDLLSTRPWHMTAFIEALRGCLGRRGRSDGELERVAMILDVGHARNNGAVSRELAPLNWVIALAPLIRTLHVHQVRHMDGKLRNHQPIEAVDERLINHEGIFAALAATPGPTTYAFIEVRDLDGALRSYETLSPLVESAPVSMGQAASTLVHEDHPQQEGNR